MALQRAAERIGRRLDGAKFPTFQKASLMYIVKTVRQSMPTLAAQLHSADKTVRILLLIRIGVKNREIKTPIRVIARAAIKHTEPSRPQHWQALGGSDS